jgi:uncharacterized protein YdiU (UPF0061 family)
MWAQYASTIGVNDGVCLVFDMALLEEAIIAAVNDGDFSAFERLLSVVSAPYEDQPAFGRYADPPRPDQVVRETFCGT